MAKPPLNPGKRVKLCSVAISTAVSVLCCLTLSYGNGLYRCGNWRKSPLLLILIVGEFLRHRIYSTFIQTNGPELVMPKSRRPLARTTINSRGHIAGSEALHWSTWVANVGKSVLILALVVAVFMALACFMGAPLTDHYTETVTLALLLTGLIALPFVLFVGHSNAIFMLRNGDDGPEFVDGSDTAYAEALRITALGVMFGAWAASIVYPLDWDRSWQAYPIPNIVGGIMGYAGANIYMLARTGIESAMASVWT